MRFEIRRADYSFGHKPSCDGAYQLPGKADEGDPWYVEVADLDALLALMAAVKHDLVLTPPAPTRAAPVTHDLATPAPHGACPRITVYDDYLE